MEEYIIMRNYTRKDILRLVEEEDVGFIPGLRQLPSWKISYRIARNRLNSGFFYVWACQIFKKYLLYGLYGVVFYVIIKYET